MPGESEDSDIYQEPNDECDYDEPEIFKDAEPAAEPIAPIPAADYNDNEVIDEEPPCYDEEIDNLDAEEFDEIDAPEPDDEDVDSDYDAIINPLNAVHSGPPIAMKDENSHDYNSGLKDESSNHQSAEDEDYDFEEDYNALRQKFEEQYKREQQEEAERLKKGRLHQKMFVDRRRA